jgi:glutathione S-transferase
MSGLYIDSTPSEISQADGLHLLTFNTPNGQKVQILLHELALLYGIKWTTSVIKIFQGTQKQPWFLRLNPNGKIPTLVDNTDPTNPVPVMETTAIMLYLAEKYDKSHALSFEDPIERAQMMQWLFFWHGSGQPIQGQLIWFSKFSNEKNPHAITRFHDESLRIYGVFELHLSGKNSDGKPRKYLAGNGKGRYSIADIGVWPWVAKWEFGGFTKDEMEKFPSLLAWVERIRDREAVKEGIDDKYGKMI